MLWKIWWPQFSWRENTSTVIEKHYDVLLLGVFSRGCPSAAHESTSWWRHSSTTMRRYWGCSLEPDDPCPIEVDTLSGELPDFPNCRWRNSFRSCWWPVSTRDQCNDVILNAMASQITSLTIVYSTVYSRRRSKKTSTLHVIGICEGNSPLFAEFPAQRASNAENVSYWWRHHGPGHLSRWSSEV